MAIKYTLDFTLNKALPDDEIRQNIMKAFNFSGPIAIKCEYTLDYKNAARQVYDSMTAEDRAQTWAVVDFDLFIRKVFGHPIPTQDIWFILGGLNNHLRDVTIDVDGDIDTFKIV